MGNTFPIRILCVFSTLDRGGAESMCMNLYRHMDRSKVQFDFIKHTSNTGAFEDEIRSLGGRIYEAPRLKVYNYLQYANWWNNHLDKHQEHQIIHGHFFSISAFYLRIAKKKGRITVSHIHASSADSILKGIIEMQIGRYADYAFACSTEAGKWIYKKKPFKVLHNAIDTDVFRYSQSIRKDMRARLSLNDELVCGTVANLTRVKNPMGLIDIFVEIKKIVPNAKLIWVGNGGLREEINQRIRREKLEDEILMLGTRTDVPSLLQAMDIFLLPSFNEGLPVSIIEAQASGLPCFISKSITQEVDITGLCCFLPIDKPSAWAYEAAKLTVKRRDMSTAVKIAGYDIYDTSSFMQSFYLDCKMGELKSKLD